MLTQWEQQCESQRSTVLLHVLRNATHVHIQDGCITTALLFFSPTVTQPHAAMGRELIQFPSYATSALQAAQNRKKYLVTTTAVPSNVSCLQKHWDQVCFVWNQHADY